MQHFTIVNRQLLLNWEDSLNLMTAICAHWNNYPFTRNSLLSPAAFLKPHATLYDLRFELEGDSVTESLKLLMEEVSKRALESVILDKDLERGPDFDKVNIGDITCFNKSEDFDKGRVTGIQGSDFLVMPTDSEKEVKSPDKGSFYYLRAHPLKWLRMSQKWFKSEFFNMWKCSYFTQSDRCCFFVC